MSLNRICTRGPLSLTAPAQTRTGRGLQAASTRAAPTLLRACPRVPTPAPNSHNRTEPIHLSRFVLTRGSLVVLFGTLVFCVSFVFSEFEEFEDWALSAILRLLGMAAICLGVLVCTVCPVDEVVRRNRTFITCTPHSPRDARPTQKTSRACTTLPHRTARALHVSFSHHALCH